MPDDGLRMIARAWHRWLWLIPSNADEGALDR
jgi:hypothetical protein